METVIKGLEECTGKGHCTECPYGKESQTLSCKKMLADVLSVVKEQEPKQVIGIADSIEGIEVGYCPSCDRAIVNKKIDETKFCKFCGQAVKWE